MWEEIMKLALGNGLWAVLFCVLLMHQLKDGKKREEKYSETIAILGERLKSVVEIKKDTEVIKTDTAAIIRRISTKKNARLKNAGKSETEVKGVKEKKAVAATAV